MARPERSLVIVGTINRDTIRSSDGVESESYGGLLYSLLSLAAIASPETRIYPVCNVGKGVEDAVRNFLSPHRRIEIDGIRFVDALNPHCFLEYDANGVKQEMLLGGVAPLEFGRIRPFLECDALCFNFITGFELSLETLQEVRQARRGLICLDVHSLTLGVDRHRRRFWQRPDRWEFWLACADVVQMNEEEGSLLADVPLREDEALLRFGEQVLGLGPKVLLVTSGKRGSRTVFRSASRDVGVVGLPAFRAATVKDETGCGDVFLMGFTWAYLQTRDVLRATRFANDVAGANCGLRGIEEIGSIGDQIDFEVVLN